MSSEAVVAGVKVGGQAATGVVAWLFRRFESPRARVTHSVGWHAIDGVTDFAEPKQVIFIRTVIENIGRVPLKCYSGHIRISKIKPFDPGVIHFAAGTPGYEADSPWHEGTQPWPEIDSYVFPRPQNGQPIFDVEPGEQHTEPVHIVIDASVTMVQVDSYFGNHKKSTLGVWPFTRSRRWGWPETTEHERPS